VNTRLVRGRLFDLHYRTEALARLVELPHLPAARPTAFAPTRP